jgi:CHASE2 domain-containing sensor protein
VLEEVEAEVLNSHSPFKVLTGYFLVVLSLSLGCAATVWTIRSQGLLQGFELSAYDSFMRLRPAEKEPDENILIVKITKNDLQEKSITNQQLIHLLSKLQQYKPRVIGLDVYRNESDKAIKQYLQKENIIATCIMTDGTSPAQDKSTPPYENFPKHRLGFADFHKDADQVLRRQFLTSPIVPGAPCTTNFSFSFQIALAFLEKDKISPDTASGQQIELVNKQLRNPSILFPQLQERERAGGYKKQEIPGYQILLNYRSPTTQTGEAFRIRSLSDITKSNVDPEWVKNKIVLIGYELEDASEQPDSGITPYSFSDFPPKLIPGVVIHAYGVSQIIDAAYGKRQLLQVLPGWIDFTWILTWALMGGIAVVFFRYPLHSLIIIGAEVVVVTVFSIGLFQIFWMPFIPSILAILLTYLSAIAYSKFQGQKYNL